MRICHDVAQGPPSAFMSHQAHYSITLGLNWLGSHKIVHRDLKLDNLLVTEDWSIKITSVQALFFRFRKPPNYLFVRDFGLSIQNDEGQIFDRFGGNVKYSAPEILNERFVRKTHSYAYGEQTDVYSYGLIWWQVLWLSASWDWSSFWTGFDQTRSV